MALLDSMAQGSPIAGLLARRRQPQGPGQEMPPLAPPKMPPIQPMQAPTGPIGPGDPRTAAASQQPPPQGLIPVQGGDPDAPVMESREGVTGGILDTLTGLNDPRLSDEENAAATRRGGIVGLLVGGAATVLGGPVGGAIAALMLGQATGSGTRQEAVQRKEMQAAIAAQEERQRVISGLYRENNPFTQEGRTGLVRGLLENGFTEEAQEMMDNHLNLEELNLAIREADAEETERLTQERNQVLFSDYMGNIDRSNPHDLRQAALFATEMGMEAQADDISAIAENIHADSDLEYRTLGGHTAALDRDGNIRARYSHSLSPSEMLTNIREDRMQREEAISHITGEWDDTRREQNWDFVLSQHRQAHQVFEQARETGVIGSVNALTIANLLMNMLNPGRGARQRTLDEILDSGGVPGEIQIALNNFLERGAGDIGAAQEVMGIVDNLAQNSVSELDERLHQFRRRAEDIGVDPSYVHDPAQHIRAQQRERERREESMEETIERMRTGNYGNIFNFGGGG